MGSCQQSVPVPSFLGALSACHGIMPWRCRGDVGHAGLWAMYAVLEFWMHVMRWHDATVPAVSTLSSQKFSRRCVHLGSLSRRHGITPWRHRGPLGHAVRAGGSCAPFWALLEIVCHGIMPMAWRRRIATDLASL